MFINSILWATFLTMLIKAFSDHAVQVDGVGGSVKYLVSLEHFLTVFLDNLLPASETCHNS